MILIIGDPHIRQDCLSICESLSTQIKKFVNDNEYKFVVILGDVLHNHEKINVVALNLAVDLFEYISKKTKLFVLVGNHDYINNSQYLTNNHWMNCLKGYNNNITIVDNVIKFENYIFCPYVPCGKLIPALNDSGYDWKLCKIIFAHQEIRNAKLNSNGQLSTIGDVWCNEYPLIISGHIHHKQKMGNVIYPGSSLPTSYADSDEKYILNLNLDPNGNFEEEYIRLDIPLKITKNISIDELNNESNNKLKDCRLVINGTSTDFDKCDTKQMLTNMEKNNVKIIKRIIEKDNNNSDNVNFYEHLMYVILKEKNNDDITKIYKKLLK